MQLNPASATIASKQHMTVNLTIASSGTFADTLQMGCNGLPYAATCTFSSPQVNLAAGATTTVQVTVDTGDPLGAGATAKVQSKSRSGVLLCFLPFALLMGLGARRRKIKPAALLLTLMLVASAMHLTGCSAQVNGTPPGVYPVQDDGGGREHGCDFVVDDDADGDPMTRAWGWCVVLSFLCGSGVRASAQALAAATGPGNYSAVGGEVSVFQADYGKREIGGIVMFADVHPTWRWGVEGEARYLRLNTAEDVTETNYLIGPRYVLRSHGLRPYVKLLAGTGKIYVSVPLCGGPVLNLCAGWWNRIFAARCDHDAGGGLRVSDVAECLDGRTAAAVWGEHGCELSVQCGGPCAAWVEALKSLVGSR